MSKKLLYLLGILLTIIIGAILYYFLCCDRVCKRPGKDVQKEGIAVSGQYEPFSLAGSEFDYSCDDNFNFLKDGFTYLQPASDSIGTGINLLKDQFDTNPGQKLVITGYCTPSEKNTSAFPNVGFARADNVKNYFVTKGFAPSSIDIKGEIVDSWRMKGNTVLGPVSYEILRPGGETGEAGIDWNEMKESLNSNPVTLYFNVNQSEIILTLEEREKIADIVKYLDHVPDASVKIVGHTDNTGDYTHNIRLGQDRASFFKSYLVQNGIAADKIVVSSKGPDEPIADNTTEEGKAKNRRSVISIL